MLKRIFIIFAAVAVIFNEGVLFAGIGVEPIILEVVVNKDKPATGVFEVLNTSKNPVHIRVRPEKWHGLDMDIRTWLKLEPVELELAQNERKDVSYKITPPVVSSGELKCMVFFVADEIGENRSNVGIRFGVPIYAIVGGTEAMDVAISDLELKYRDNVLSGTIMINNKCNVHIRPDISVDVLNSKDKLISSYNLPQGQPAQAGQNRPFMFQQYLILQEGKYKAVVKVDYGKLYGLDGSIITKKKALLVKKDEKAE